jgi:hypothetical protein
VVRQIANEVVLDVLLYLTPAFRSRILNSVRYKINKYYHKFCDNNPSFVQDRGKCSVLGHSLGTVILFDLLALQADPAGPVAGDGVRMTYERQYFLISIQDQLATPLMSYSWHLRLMPSSPWDRH